MDAMGLTLKKPHTVSTSLSGSLNHDPAESPKFPGIVSTESLRVLSEASLASSASLSSSARGYAPSSLTCLLH